MMAKNARGIAAELCERCAEAYRAGKDFPTILSEIIRGNPAVLGMPVQGVDSQGPTLEIRLTSGQYLVFHAKGFSLR